MRKYELQQCSELRKDINEMEERLFELESSAQRITPVLSDMPKGSSKASDSRAEIVAEIVETQLQINYNVALLHIKIKKIENEMHIKQLTDKEATVIRLRYIECLKWEQICDRIGCSIRQIHNIHALALKRLE